MSQVARVLVAAAVGSLLLSSCVLDWASLRGDGGNEVDDAAPVFEAGFGDVSVVDATHDRDVNGFDADVDADADATVDDDASTDAADESFDAFDSQLQDSSADVTDAKADVADAADAADASSCAYAFSGTLASFDFTGQPGNQVSTAVTSSTSGLVVGNIGRSSVVVAAMGSNSINSTSWATTSTLDSTRYYTLTITPPSKCALDLTSITIDSKSSSTGPANGAVATSDDSFVKTVTFVPGSSATPSLSVSGATSAVEIRIYGYAATSSAGTFRIQTTLSVSGALK